MRAADSFASIIAGRLCSVENFSADWTASCLNFLLISNGVSSITSISCKSLCLPDLGLSEFCAPDLPASLEDRAESDFFSSALSFLSVSYKSSSF